MPNNISEPDWKIFRDLRAVALERFCERTLTAMTECANDSGKSYYERYQAVYQMMEEHESLFATAFDDAKRSRAIMQLAEMSSAGLLKPSEMAKFSQDTRDAVEDW